MSTQLFMFDLIGYQTVLPSSMLWYIYDLAPILISKKIKSSKMKKKDLSEQLQSSAYEEIENRITLIKMALVG